jgi:hypothetical protein
MAGPAMTGCPTGVQVGRGPPGRLRGASAWSFASRIRRSRSARREAYRLRRVRALPRITMAAATTPHKATIGPMRRVKRGHYAQSDPV